MTTSAEVVICGAGIAGVSTAYFLAKRAGIKNILLVDERPPLTLTSDHSTECYRNWWPGPGDAMVKLMNRSIDLMEELADTSGNVFQLNRRGYLYMTADPSRVKEMETTARSISSLGAGALRIHRGQQGDPSYLPATTEGFHGQPSGADLLLDRNLIQEHFPYVSEKVIAALHVRRAGWFSGQQLGMHLLEQARASGVRLIDQQVTSVEQENGQVTSVRLSNGDGILTRIFINAAGPMQTQVAEMLGVNLPIFSELHQKVAFKDSLEVVARHAPLLVWTDPQSLNWSAEERQMLAEEPELASLLGRLPAGVHTRPEGGAGSQMVLMLWEYHTQQMQPSWPLPLDDQYAEIVLRGLVPMLPGLRMYLEKFPRPRHDGGYYTKTRENRPLIGPLPVSGAYLIGALSGFGLMAACAAGELIAAYIAEGDLPDYAPAFRLERYSDANYLRLFEQLDASGQL